MAAQELLQMGRLRCRQVWVAGASNEHHCGAPPARCQAAWITESGHGREAEGWVSAKVAVPPAGRAHLRLGKPSRVQKRTLSTVITQVFLSEVLTEVLSMLRTGLPNGKSPHGGF